MIFKKFPKQRIPLSEEYQKIYELHYKENREGNSVASAQSQKLERWLHKQVAKTCKLESNTITLEIGAGTLNQLNYERNYRYDIVEPFEELYKNSDYKKFVNTFFLDISEVSQPIYDRIISIATFEHILNLPEVIAKTCLLFNDINKGVLSCAIPSQGDVLWKLGYSLSTGIEFRLKYGLKYSTLMNYEHVNTANEIEEVLRYFYENVKKDVFGLGKYFPVYRSYECYKPNLKKAKEYLEQMNV